MAAANRPLMQSYEAHQTSAQALTGLSGPVLPTAEQMSMIRMFRKVRPESVGLKALENQLVDDYASAADAMENNPYFKMAYGADAEGVAVFAAVKKQWAANKGLDEMMLAASGAPKLPGYIQKLSATGVKGLRQ